MGNGPEVLPPPTGTPVPPPPVAPRAPTLPELQEAPRNHAPLPPVLHQVGPPRTIHHKSLGWPRLKRAVAWLFIIAAVTFGIMAYPRVRERLALRTPKITKTQDGVEVAVGAMSFRLPNRPKTLLVHLAGSTKGTTGYRLTTEQGTVEVDVVTTSAVRDDDQLTEFCTTNIDALTARNGSPPLKDTSGIADGVYRRDVAYTVNGQYVFATCKGHRRNSAFVWATTPLPRFHAFDLAAETLIVGD